MLEKESANAVPTARGLWGAVGPQLRRLQRCRWGPGEALGEGASYTKNARLAIMDRKDLVISRPEFY